MERVLDSFPLLFAFEEITNLHVMLLLDFLLNLLRRLHQLFLLDQIVAQLFDDKNQNVFRLDDCHDHLRVRVDHNDSMHVVFKDLRANVVQTFIVQAFDQSPFGLKRALKRQLKTI
jgi:hypothetical protein